MARGENPPAHVQPMKEMVAMLEVRGIAMGGGRGLATAVGQGRRMMREGGGGGGVSGPGNESVGNRCVPGCVCLSVSECV